MTEEKTLEEVTADDLKTAGWDEGTDFAFFLASIGFWKPEEWYAGKKDNYDPETLTFRWNKLTAAEQIFYDNAFEAWQGNDEEEDKQDGR